MTQIIGHGSQFEVNTTGTTYVAVAGVTAVDFGSDKVDTHDTTDMGTTGITRTYIGGLENPGDVSIKMNLLPGDATQADLYTFKDGLPHNFKAITAGTVSTRTFSGIITSLDVAIPDDKLATLTCKIQISGPVVIS